MHNRFDDNDRRGRMDRGGRDRYDNNRRDGERDYERSRYEGNQWGYEGRQQQGRSGDMSYRNEDQTGSSMRGSDYKRDTGYQSSDRQYSGVSQYGRGYGLETGDRRGGESGGWSTERSNRDDSQYQGRGSQGEQGSRYGRFNEGSDRSDYGSSYGDSRSGRFGGSNFRQEEERGWSGRDQDNRQGRSEYGWQTGRDEGREAGWRGEYHRDSNDNQGYGSFGSQSGGYDREEGRGSQYRGQSGGGRDYRGESRDYNRDDRSRLGSMNEWNNDRGTHQGGERWREDYGSSESATHGDNYRRGDRRSEFGRH